MDKYLEADAKLAKLLYGADLSGKQVEFAGESGIMSRWTRDNAAAFALMVEHGLVMNLLPTLEYVIAGVGFMVSEGISKHPDKETAVRFAIVQAVIAKLEDKHD